MTTAWEYAARAFEPRVRRWPTPGALAVELDPATVQTPALDLIDRELVALADGEFDRLMVFVSPQEGKSVRVSQRFVEWLLADNPELRVAIVSYADEMARRWGSDIKLDLETFNGFEGTTDLGLRLRADSRAAGRWQIDGHKGGVYCVGVGGSLTGKPVDVLCHRRPHQGPGAGPVDQVPGSGEAVLAGRRRPPARARRESRADPDQVA
jgi:hypothetical protein